ncbi:hypothetical protein [Paenibacillus sp. GCM10027626]|uniref:hypothetical protein n=1 Tax=Paenibacillus sp. GCM10027626 TaxID=3273411 RepID=UPI003643C719
MQGHNSFVIQSDAPYSLNFLVYIQNAFLNSRNERGDHPKFPYTDVSQWALIEEELFLRRFQEVWEQVIYRLSNNDDFTHEGNLAMNTYIKCLFQNNEDGERGYDESSKSFRAWWGSMAGQIAVERLIGDHIYEDIYQKLSATIKEDKRLRIRLVYDKFSLATLNTLPWHAVLPIEDVFLYKKKDTVSLLLSCCGH